MIGLYVHIPFCKSRCKYCDFYSTTLLEKRTAYVDHLVKTIPNLAFLDDNEVQTIYLGGGTPSMLAPEEIGRILEAIRQRWHVLDDAEITMEANPGDLTPEMLGQLHFMGINRLSIGIQSFNDNELRTIGRRHTANEAEEVVRWAQQAGFHNLSIDLMYGLPGQTIESWTASINRALALGVQHISTYCLSYENGTVLTRMRDEGTIHETDEETLRQMYDMLIDRLEEKGYEHYEVSNFALKDYHSRHNSNYWNATPYLGIGAGAHSYDGEKRWWNGPDGTIEEVEYLTEEQKRMEAIMLGLRTSRGIPTRGLDLPNDKVQQFIDQGLIQKQLTPLGEYLMVTRQGWHILNRIIEELI